MQQLGDYKLIEKIGAGGMGEVWRGENVHTHLECAVKLLPLEATRDANFIARFFDEGRVMQTLKHEYIVPVHHVGHDEKSGRHYLVMDFVAGADGESQSLHDLLKASEDGRLPESDVRRWSVQIAVGLAYAHKQGIVHRDIKPANILIDADNNARIADFGLAKAVGDEYIQSQIHQSTQHSMSGSLGDQPTILNAAAKQKRSSGSRPIEGTLDGLDTIQPGQSSDGTHRSTAESILGTYDYMSPEQRNELPGVPVGPPSDIYAYGVMIYRLLTGRRPAGIAEPPSALGLCASWDRVISRCLKHQPADRYADGSLLARDLAPPIPGKLVTPVRPFTKKPPTRMKSLLVGIIAAVVSFLLVGGWLMYTKSDAGEGEFVQEELSVWSKPAPCMLLETKWVGLESNRPATLYYTRDGTPPDRTSQRYQSHTSITPGMTLRCLAVCEGEEDKRFTFSFPAGIPKPTLRRYSGGHSGEIKVPVPLAKLPKGASWHYTMDGSAPSKNSPIMDQPLKFFPPVKLSVRGFGKGSLVGELAVRDFPLPTASLDAAIALRKRVISKKSELGDIPDTPQFRVLSKSLNDALAAGDQQQDQKGTSWAEVSYSKALKSVDQIKKLLALHEKAIDRHAAFGKKLTETDLRWVAALKTDFDAIAQSYAKLKSTLTAEEYAKTIQEVASLESRYVLWAKTAKGIGEGERDWEALQDRITDFSDSRRNSLHVDHEMAKRFIQEKDYAKAAERYTKISEAAWASVPELSAHDGSRVYSVSFSPDGKFALSGASDKTIKYWDLQTRKRIRTLEGHADKVFSVSISQDGKHALSGSSDRTVRYWDLETGKCIRTHWGHTGTVFSVWISPDGKFALSGSEDGTLRYWDLQTGKCIRTLVGHADTVSSVSISQDGRHALSGSSDRTLIYWDLKTGKCLRTLKEHRSPIVTVAISPDGKCAVSADSYGRIHYWDIETGDCLLTLKDRSMRQVSSISISPDGKYVLSGGRDKLLRYWGLQTGKCIRTLKGQLGEIDSVSISPDGRFGLSGSSFGKVALWRLPKPKDEK